MGPSTSDLLTEFAVILKHILPSEIKKSLKFTLDDKIFTFRFDCIAADNLFSSIKVKRNFLSLIDGLYGEIRFEQNKDGHSSADFIFDVTNTFLDSVKKNIDFWGLTHPLQAFKAAWESSKGISGIGKS